MTVVADTFSRFASSDIRALSDSEALVAVSSYRGTNLCRGPGSLGTSSVGLPGPLWVGEKNDIIRTKCCQDKVVKSPFYKTYLSHIIYFPPSCIKR